MDDLILKFKSSIEEANGKCYIIEKIDEISDIILEITENFKNVFIHNIDEKIEEYVKNILKNNGKNVMTIEDLKRDPGKIEIGITGAHAMAAESGSIIFYENGVLTAFTSFLPEKHIVIEYSDKIFPEILDALDYVVKESGKMPSYIQIIQGPSYTGDIEKKIVRPSHGPRELHVLIVKR